MAQPETPAFRLPREHVAGLSYLGERIEAVMAATYATDLLRLFSTLTSRPASIVAELAHTMRVLTNAEVCALGLQVGCDTLQQVDAGGTTLAISYSYANLVARDIPAAYPELVCCLEIAIPQAESPDPTYYALIVTWDARHKQWRIPYWPPGEPANAILLKLPGAMEVTDDLLETLLVRSEAVHKGELPITDLWISD